MSLSFSSRLSRATRGWFAGTVLDSHAEPYVAWLEARGYAPGTIDRYLRAVAHFAHWSAPRLNAIGEIDEELVRRFVDDHLPQCRCAPCCVRSRADVRAALVQLLAQLRTEGLSAESALAIPAAIEAELQAFDTYLADVRGLQAVTRYQGQLKHVYHFLLAHFVQGALQMATLAPDDIARFVTEHTAGWKPTSVKQVCIALRSYLRFKAVQGMDTASLAGAVPHVAQWRLSQLPRGLSRQEVEQLLGAFDRRTANGRRDYAIARCYVDLGLRTAEIGRLQLDDLDWQQGQIRIRSKGRRTDVLPLPPTTARAIVAYLRSGRRATPRRDLFLRHRPPLERPVTPTTIRGAIRNAARRCGLATRLPGPHVLRHTIACRLVQSGASFKAIADLLRHRSLDTTMIYAKVDLEGLKKVALPWPGRRP
ncbi:MAG: site-specific integrase [Gammaproteobacteria bacterium]|nr:site-specific integrase [Gammaproteobacteria bacterium]